MASEFDFLTNIEQDGCIRPIDLTPSTLMTKAPAVPTEDDQLFKQITGSSLESLQADAAAFHKTETDLAQIEALTIAIDTGDPEEMRKALTERIEAKQPSRERNPYLAAAAERAAFKKAGRLSEWGT